MITDEMKTRAALAALNACWADYGWPMATSLDDVRPEEKADWLREATAALEAVAADIRNAALEEAKAAVEDAGWYRNSDSDVTWDAQDEQVHHSVAAIEALKSRVTS